LYSSNRIYEGKSAYPPGPADLVVPSCSHLVQLYENDAAFLESLAEFVGASLIAGGACIVVATPIHHKRLADRLIAKCIDPVEAAAEGRFTALNAEEILGRFMVNGRLEARLFYGVIEPELERAKRALTRPSSPLVAFGEMVAILWSEGKREAAIELEHLWNDLVIRHNFSLRCAYPIDCFAKDSQPELFQQMCSAHTDIVPTENYMLLANEADRLRMVSFLQHQVSTVQSIAEERERAIDQREKVEEKLRRSEEFTRSVLEGSVDCIKVLDLDGRLLYMSEPGQRALGIRDVNEYLGCRWVDFWKEEDTKRAEDTIATAGAGGVGSFQGDSLLADGTKKSWDVRITPALDKDGQIERLIAVSRDITELHNAQQAAIQAEKLAAAGRLAATIAHEINNPLEAVTNFIYLAMTAEGLPKDVSRYLEIADRELARVAQIAQQTLGFYRDNSKRRLFRVAELLHDVMIIYERKLANKNLRLQTSFDPELKVYGKHGELRQALSNLIANAIDASKAGGKIWLRAHLTKNWTNGMKPGVRITLADKGCGMAPEVQKRIFVPFYTTKSDVGTGIGLWATKCLIEQQGGYIHFRSRQGETHGTVMSMFLPGTHADHVLD
jgi:PAS domain S-box-containing protein